MRNRNYILLWLFIAFTGFICMKCKYHSSNSIDSESNSIKISQENTDSNNEKIVIIDTSIGLLNYRVYLKLNSERIYLDVGNHCLDSIYSFADKNEPYSNGIVVKSGNEFKFLPCLISGDFLFCSHDAFSSTKNLYVINTRFNKFIEYDSLYTLSSSYGGFLFKQNCFYCSEQPKINNGELPQELNYLKITFENNKLGKYTRHVSFWNRECLWDSTIFYKICNNLIVLK